jgi:putative membrane protein
MKARRAEGYFGRTKIMEKWVALMIFSASLGLTFVGCGTNSSGNTTAINRANMSNTVVASNNILQSNGNAAGTANANSTTVSTAGSGDFWSEAAIGGMTEVELGKLAAQKAKNAEVKKFAQMMVTDHSKANDELKSLAQKKNITLPTQLDSAHQSDIQALQSESADNFDKEYVDMMVEDHEKDVAFFQRQASTGTDPDAKAFAAKTLPVLQKHLDAIKAIQAKMK